MFLFLLELSARDPKFSQNHSYNFSNISSSTLPLQASHAQVDQEAPKVLLPNGSPG